MQNKKWYYRINLETLTAIEYTQILDSWGNVSGLNATSLVDEATIADMNWAGHNEGFLSKEAALAKGVTQAELDRVMPVAEEVCLELVRQKRNTLLSASDRAVVIDRWETYTQEQKTTISTYRQALRDITTTGDVFNPTWPDIPEIMGFLNAYN
jgi:hypothetical protein